MSSRSSLGRRRSRAIRIDGWIDRWIPGGRILLERIDRIAVAYLERRYLVVGRHEGSTDSTNGRN